MEVRTSARLVLIDGRGRILLFRHVDPAGREFWATPGGGVERGESLEQAARREAEEELGALEVSLSRLWSGHTRFVFGDHEVSQTETFFQIRDHSRALGPGIEATHRREGIVEARWWSADEIERASETVYPTDLACRLKEIVQGV